MLADLRAVSPAAHDDVVRADDQQVLALLVEADRVAGHGDRLVWDSDGIRTRTKRPGRMRRLGVREDRRAFERAGAPAR